MKLWNPRYLGLFIAYHITFFQVAAAEDRQPNLADAIQLIESWLDAQCDFDSVPGMSVGIVQDQDLIWSKGYGFANIEQKQHTKPNTIYSIASITKLFTAIGVMSLWEDGKLRLDDKVADLLPWFNIKQSSSESVPLTIRTLLTHTSGLPRESNFPYWSEPEFPFPTVDAVKAMLGEQETVGPAGTRFNYSNLGFALLGSIIEEVSGQKFDDYIVTKILRPLEMNHTGFQPIHPDLLATGYSARSRNGIRKPQPLFDMKGIKAAGGLFSTVEDIAKFASWQFRLHGQQEREILKPSTLREMQRAHWVDQKDAWGLGGYVSQDSGTLRVGHDGLSPGFTSEISIFPEKKIAVIVMINGLHVDMGKYLEGIIAVLDKAGVDGAEEVSDTKTKAIKEFSGRYDYNPWFSEIWVTPWFGDLAVVAFPIESPVMFWKIRLLESDRFFLLLDDHQKGSEGWFERNDDGKVIGFWFESNSYKRVDTMP